MNPITVFLTAAGSPWARDWAQEGIFMRVSPVAVATIASVSK